MFWILTPYQIYNLQIFTPFLGLPFTVQIASFHKNFIFLYSSIYLIFLLLTVSGIICKNSMS